MTTRRPEIPTTKTTGGGVTSRAMTTTSAATTLIMRRINAAYQCYECDAGGIGRAALQNRERTRKRPSVDGDSRTTARRDDGRARTVRKPVANGFGLPCRRAAPIKGRNGTKTSHARAVRIKN